MTFKTALKMHKTEVISLHLFSNHITQRRILILMPEIAIKS